MWINAASAMHGQSYYIADNLNNISMHGIGRQVGKHLYCDHALKQPTTTNTSPDMSAR